MYEIQRFALENIYCASAQDRQFCFELHRVTKKDFPVKRTVKVYEVNKQLPNMQSSFHVFVIGNINPSVLSLVRQKREWFRDVWVNAEEDINSRNITIQLYNELGVNYPRSKVYYSFIDESSIIITIEIDRNLARTFDIDSFKYLRIYSNTYFNTLAYNSLPVKHGIKCELFSVINNVDKVAIQNKIATYKQVGGDVIIYVNGYYTDNLNLNIPNDSYVEVIYDQSIISKEKFTIGDLRTFQSNKDNVLKYIVFRDNLVNVIQYNDDVDIYISTNNELVTKGVYYYKHTNYAIRNLTDKDFALSSSFVNNQASMLSANTTGSVQDKVIVLYTRKSGISKPLIYSSLKLHEFYKLPQSVEHDVLSNMNYTITELRAEYLENSSYFNIASQTQLKEITNILATNAIGYNGIKYYYGNTPTVISTSLNIAVPLLYNNASYAYEYDQTGLLINKVETNGPMYTCSSDLVKFVEFFKGQTPSNFDPLYNNTSTISLRNSEYIILSAYYDSGNRISNWEDITINATKVNILDNIATITEDEGKFVRIFYLDQPYTYDLELPLVDGILYFPLTLFEDRGSGNQKYLLDLPYGSLEVFLNGNRLNFNIDYFIKYPYLSICSKMYFDYSKPNQSLHIRLTGYSLNKDDINKEEIVGFVNNGTLTRNNYYDIRDDRVFSIYVKGKLYNRSLLRFAEEDNTVRLTHHCNGLPYTMSETLTSIKEITGLPTLPTYTANKTLDDKISNLYELIYPEPNVDMFNVIADHYYLFSPLVSKILHDAIDGDLIPFSFYTTPYNDSDILQLIDTNYKLLHELDPVSKPLPFSIIEIHPTPFGDVVNVSLHIYRFMTNVVRVLTNNNPNRVNLSGYLSITVPSSSSNEDGDNLPPLPPIPPT